MVAASVSHAAPPTRRARERGFQLALVAPSIFVLLLIGIFPLVYLLVVSFQNITMLDVDRSFQGLLNYRLLFQDERLWGALLHTLIFIVVALPVELILGLFMAQLFIDRLPGRQVFIALLVLPVVVSPIVAGATWSLMFDNRFGPINQIIGWLAGGEVTLLWTIHPHLVYPAILVAEIWQ
jgi:multiple sugar transport system permease protein